MSHVTSGFRRLIAADYGLRERGFAADVAAELHQDGSMAATTAVGHDWRRPHRDTGETPDVLTIGDEALTLAVISLLYLVGSHAGRCGAGGDITVVASIFSSTPVELGQKRSMHGLGGRVGGTRSLAEFEELSHTLPLESLQMPGPELIAASYLVASDLLSGFGHPEAVQLTLNGEIRWPYVNHFYRPQVERWCERFGVTILDHS